MDAPSPDRTVPPADPRLGYVLLGLIALTVLIGLGSFGIWDPWEIEVAEVARKWATGEHATVKGSPFGPWLTSVAFEQLGVREWTGRLPLALFGLLALLSTYVLGARHGGRGVGILGAVAFGTTPLFLMNSRLMLGAAPHMALQALTAVALMEVAFPPPGAPRSLRAEALAVALAAVACGASAWASGVLVGPLPPLVAVTLAAVLGRETTSTREALVKTALVSATGALVVGAFLAARRDAPEYTAWLGGGAVGGEPPSFEREIERIFHNLAPWSALLIPALGNLLRRLDAPPEQLTSSREDDPGADEPSADATAGAGVDSPDPVRPPLAMFLVLWLAADFAATTILASRYGIVPLYGGTAAAIAVGVLLHDVNRSGRTHWTVVVIGGLFTLLLIRDFAMFPGSPISGTAGTRPEVPDEGFDARLGWAASLGAFALGVIASIGIGPEVPRPKLRGARERLRELAGRSRGHKAWFALGGLVIVGLLGYGVTAFVAPQVFNSLGMRLGRLMLLGLPAVPLLVLALFYARWIVSRLGSYRLAPLVAAGVGVGAYFAFGFVPALSQHLSPREVFETYDSLRGPDEPLGEYQTGSRAAPYYTDGELVQLRSTQDIATHLIPESGRAWAVFPADNLTAVNRLYRARTGRHLYVVDASNATLVLAASEPIEGREDQNQLARSILSEMPREPQFPVNVRFGNKLELVGYDLELPGGDSVGPSQSFTVTWYWRALPGIGGGYQIFLHIDGHGQRLNGDHNPVDDLYPVAQWQEGDIIVDRQELDVAANYPPGDYQMWIGFFAGSNRLEVMEVPRCEGGARGQCQDDANRLLAGILSVR